MARRGTTAKIDLAELEKLSGMQATDEEIASWFGVTTRTIERRRKSPAFAEVMQRGRAKGRLSIRRMQLKLLEAGNATMGVWLGKQYLGQSDQVQHAYDVSVTTCLGIPRLDPARNGGVAVDAQFREISGDTIEIGERGPDPALTT